jgi:hypothetical protein
VAVNLRLTWPAPAWQFVRRPCRWPIATAGAAGAAGEPPPNPCKTFTAPTAHRLFEVSGSTKLRETGRSFGHGSNQIRTCTIKHARHVLVVNVARFSEDFGAPVKCFNRPKLGKHGVVCVSTQKSFPITFALFRKNGLYFTDSATVATGLTSGASAALPSGGVIWCRCGMID